MIQPIIIMLVGLSWVSASLFFRRELDPIYADVPLISSLIIILLLLMHAIVLAGLGRNLGRPYQKSKKNRGVRGMAPPSQFFIGTWSFLALVTIGAGFLFRISDFSLAAVLWTIGGTTLLAALCFLLIPAQVHSENAEGDIVFKPNPVQMAPKALYFWTSAIFYGAFFLIAGTILKSSAPLGGMISIGTGAGWLLGAMILSIVALFRMGLQDEVQTVSVTKLLVPEENFAQIIGNTSIQNELTQILYRVATAQKSLGHVPNGILLTGPSPISHLILARALAGEYKRPFYNFSLKTLLTVEREAFDNFWKGFLFKVKPFNSLVIYIADYGSTIVSAARSNPQGLHNIQDFLFRLFKNRTHLLIASANNSEDLPKPFISPPIIHWTIPVPMPDQDMRITLIRRFLIEESKRNEILPGNVPLLTPEMINGFDLAKLATLMEGFAPEDIKDVVFHSRDYARKLRRSLRQLDIDVSIRRKAQNWKDPTAGPMEVVRSRLTDQTIGPIMVNRAYQLFSNRQKKVYESILIFGRNRSVRKMIAERLAKQADIPFLTAPEDKRLDGPEFRNLLMRSRKHQRSMIFIDPLEEIFPKVQLSNYGYHGEIYNQKVMEISQIIEDKNIWLISGAEDVNKIDPFIARRYTSLLDLSELGRSLFSELEEFSLGKILEGVAAEKIDFEEFDEPPQEEMGDSLASVEEEESKIQLMMPLPPEEAIPGFPGRPEMQEEIRGILDADAFNIKKHGSGIRGAFLFAGPRGTGKREAAQAIANHLNASKGTFIARDMGLFSDRLFASMFLQRPLGSTKSSPVPEGIRTILEEKPESVLFLENIEQAHPSAWDFLPAYLQDGVMPLGGKPLHVPQSTLILSTSLFSGDEMELALKGNRSELILEKLSEKNRRLAFLPVFSRNTLNALDLIVPFPTYNDSDVMDISRRILFETLHDFIAHRPLKGTLDVDSEVPAFITLQIDPSTVTLATLNRTVQSMLMPVLKELESQSSHLTSQSSLMIGIQNNRLALIEGAPVADLPHSETASSGQ